MFSHYLTTALRHFRQHKLTTGINVACLALGLTSFMLAWGTVAYLGQMDRHHSRSPRIYLMTTQLLSSTGDTGPAISTVPWQLKDKLLTDFPELESVARLTREDVAINVDGRNDLASVAYADPELLKTFDLRFIAGGATAALNEPRSAVVSAAFAQRWFGTTDVIGRVMRLSNREDVTITGVIAPVSKPSHLSTEPSTTGLTLSFDALVSMDTYVAILEATAPDIAGQTTRRWSFNRYFTYVVLPQDGSLSAQYLNSRLDEFSRRHVPEQDGQRRYRLRPIADFTAIGLDTFAGTHATGVSSTAILQALAGLVLLVASLNYANLATAQAVTRTKEVAMRRVVGASRRQVMLQYFFEAFLLTGTALALALLAIGLITWAAGTATLAGIVSVFSGMPQFWACQVGLMLAVSLLAGAYPALNLSRVRPAHALRTARSRSGPRFASTLLVGLQFGSASFLMIAVFVIVTQNRDLKRAIWNPASDPIVVLANNVKGANVDPRLLKAELMRKTGVSTVSGVERMPWGLGGMGAGLAVTADISATQVRAAQNIVEQDFFSTLQIPILAGRIFARDRADDLTVMTAWQRVGAGEFNIVIDHSLTRALGITNPQDAVGKILYRRLSLTGSTPPQRLHVIGVVGDTLLRPISFGTSASFYLMNPDVATIPVIRFSKHSVATALAGIDEVWNRLAPGMPLKRRFADEQFEQAHQFLNLISGTFALLAAFASAIAMMGLIAMALHVTRRRMHEIGVRKTLGASVGQIVLILLRSFSTPVVIANLAVWPLAYLVMRAYLGIFAHSSGIAAGPFLLTLAITLAIAWIAVGGQAIRAARLKPATVLRYE
jgi:putative ABC transport system permease protein